VAKVIINAQSAEMRKFMASPQGEPFQLLERAVDDVMVRAPQWVRRLTTTRTGTLANSFKRTPVALQGSKLIGGVENTADYAMFVHDGTKRHPIVARRAKVLHWISPGRPPWAAGPVFVPAVIHPGTKPRPFLFMAWQEVGRRHGFTVTKG
jgi:hypothetical protein